MYKLIEFPSEGVMLRGRLYLPEKPSVKLPVIVMAHGYSCTIEGMVADCYAEVFCKNGYAIILYDHHSFGISEGYPRQQTNKWIQARGYRDAINYAITLSEVDPTKIGIWGDSMSANEALVVAAIDQRVKAVIAQVPACGDDLPSQDPDGKLYESIRETFLHGDVKGTPETTHGPLPVVSFDQETFPSMLAPLTAYRWFIEYGGRYNTKWKNRVTHVEPKVPVKFNSLLCIPYIKAALLMMVAFEDEMEGASSVIARAAFDAAPQPKELIEVDGGHFGIIHYPGILFEKATAQQVNFLNRYLNKNE